ncbi:hypothetical protein V8B97DRAFT_1919190 [Scleroderma yunnanense]
MPNLISFQLPVTHTGMYCDSFSPQTLNLLCKDQEVQVDLILLDIKQKFETPKCYKFFKSSEHNEEIVLISDCGEKLLFNTPIKATSKDKPDINNSITKLKSKDEQIKTTLANGDGLLTFYNSSLYLHHSSLSQDLITFPT